MPTCRFFHTLSSGAECCPNLTFVNSQFCFQVLHLFIFNCFRVCLVFATRWCTSSTKSRQKSETLWWRWSSWWVFAWRPCQKRSGWPCFFHVRLLGYRCKFKKLIGNLFGSFVAASQNKWSVSDNLWCLKFFVFDPFEIPALSVVFATLVRGFITQEDTWFVVFKRRLQSTPDFWQHVIFKSKWFNKTIHLL